MFASSPGVIGPFMRLLLMGLAIWGSLGTPAEVFAAMASRNDGAHHASPSLLATSASLTVISRSILAAEGGVDDLARVTFDRGRRLDRLADAGTPVGRVRNFDVPDPAADAHRVAGSLTRGPGVVRWQVREGLTVFRPPEGGQVVLRALSAGRSRLWAVDVHDVPGYPRILTHFRPR